MCGNSPRRPKNKKRPTQTAPRRALVWPKVILPFYRRHRQFSFEFHHSPPACVDFYPCNIFEYIIILRMVSIFFRNNGRAGCRGQNLFAVTIQNPFCYILYGNLSQVRRALFSVSTAAHKHGRQKTKAPRRKPPRKINLGVSKGCRVAASKG